MKTVFRLASLFVVLLSFQSTLRAQDEPLPLPEETSPGSSEPEFLPRADELSPTETPPAAPDAVPEIEAPSPSIDSAPPPPMPDPFGAQPDPMQDQPIRQPIITEVPSDNQGTTRTAVDEEEDRGDGREQKRLWGYIGVDAGYNRISTDLPEALEYNKNGYQINGKGLLSYYWYHIVLDAGFGYFFNRSWENKDAANGETITTKAVFAEISPRFRFNDSWQLGPTVNFNFASDVNLSASGVRNGTPVGGIPDGSNWALFGGLQLVYEFPIEEWLRMRLVARAMTDANIEDRQVIMAQIGVQIGLPLYPWKEEPKPLPPPPPPPPAVMLPPPPPPPPPAVEAPVKVLKVNLENEFVYFDFDKDQLNKASKDILNEIGAFLMANSGVWGAIVVEGHTDSRGTVPYNSKLSKRRAESVRKALISAGIPADRIKSEGFWFSRPKVEGSNEYAWAKNRRVELAFQDVSDPKLIRDKIREIKTRILGPDYVDEGN